MKAWIYRRGESYYVGWRTPFGRKKARSCGPGADGLHRAEDLRKQISNELYTLSVYSAVGEKRHCKNLGGIDAAELLKFDGQPVVYFVEAVGMDRVKIGASASLTTRLRAIRTYCPTKTKVLLVVAGEPKLENRFHRQFKAFRLHGEWFQLSESLRNAIWKLKYPRKGQETAPGNRL